MIVYTKFSIVSNMHMIIIMSCAIYTHTLARKSSTNFQLYYFAIRVCSTSWLGHGHGYKRHSSYYYYYHDISIIIIIIVVHFIIYYYYDIIIIIIIMIMSAAALSGVYCLVTAALSGYKWHSSIISIITLASIIIITLYDYLLL